MNDPEADKVDKEEQANDGSATAVAAPASPAAATAAAVALDATAVTVEAPPASARSDPRNGRQLSLPFFFLRAARAGDVGRLWLATLDSADRSTMITFFYKPSLVAQKKNGNPKP